MMGARQGRFVSLSELVLALLNRSETNRNKFWSMCPFPYSSRVSAQAPKAETRRNKTETNSTAPLTMGRNEGAKQAQHNPIGVLRVSPTAPVDCWADQVRRGLDVFGSFPWGWPSRGTRDFEGGAATKPSQGVAQ